MSIRPTTPSGIARSRWAAIGAAVAVSLGTGGLLTASATVSEGERAIFVPITPCRLLDTRPGAAGLPLAQGDGGSDMDAEDAAPADDLFDDDL